MKKEIEELLDKLKDKDWYEELDLTGTKWIELKQEETNLLLSYIEQLEKKVDQYENPDDLTLFYMWLDEKAKDKMKQLENNRDKAIEYINEMSGYDVEDYIRQDLLRMLGEIDE